MKKKTATISKELSISFGLSNVLNLEEPYDKTLIVSYFPLFASPDLEEPHLLGFCWFHNYYIYFAREWDGTLVLR